MKKLLALVLVLAISATASAGTISLQISGRNGQSIAPVTDIKDVLQSEYLWIDVIYNGDAGLYAMDSYFQVTGPGTIALTELTYPTGAWDSGWTAVGSDTGGQYIYVNAGITFTGVADGGIVVDHILFHCEGPGDVTVVPVMTDAHGGGLEFDFESVPTAGTGVTIHQIPEPLTMALMSLGGLVALRRRR